MYIITQFDLWHLSRQLCIYLLFDNFIETLISTRLVVRFEVDKVKVLQYSNLDVVYVDESSPYYEESDHKSIRKTDNDPQIIVSLIFDGPYSCSLYYIKIDIHHQSNLFY